MWVHTALCGNRFSFNIHLDKKKHRSKNFGKLSWHCCLRCNPTNGRVEFAFEWCDIIFTIVCIFFLSVFRIIIWKIIRLFVNVQTTSGWLVKCYYTNFYELKQNTFWYPNKMFNYYRDYKQQLNLFICLMVDTVYP